MAHKAIERARAEVAFAVSMLMLKPAFNKYLAAIDMRNEAGNIPMLVAGPDESAVVTMHRMEAMGVTQLLLVSEKNSKLRMTSFTVDFEEREAGAGSIEILGGVTVWDWMTRMLEGEEGSYFSNGSDIMPTARTLEYAV